MKNKSPISADLQKSLREIEDYKYALDQSSIVAITDQKGIIKYVNDNFCKISKYSREELLGQDHRIINSGHHSKEFIRDLWVTIAHGKIWKGELKNKAKDGTHYWVDTTIVPFLNEEDKPYQYVAIRADITEKKKLEEQQELFGSIVNSSDDAILSKTLDGIITSWNPGAEKIFGYAATEIIGKHISVLIPAHLRDEENKIIETIRKGRAFDHYETERIKKDGTVIYVSLTISPVKDAAGNITGASKIVRDITRQKRSDEEVIKAFKEKEIVLNRISDGVVSVDNDWRYTFLNDAALATHPLGKEETLGKVIWDVHPEMKGTVFWDKYHEAMRTRKVVELESHYASMNILFSVKVYPSADGLTIFYKDITESKKAEQELAQSLKEITDYKFALDESSIVAITDQKGIIKYANDNFCNISKYTRKELIGQDHRIINSGYHPKEFIKNLWVTIASGNIWKGELKNRAKDGTIYWVDTTIVPFLDDKGKPYQYVAIRADITDRKNAENEILKLNEELEQKVISRTAELDTLNKEMESFTYSVSHDLRAPLRGVIGFATILEDEYSKQLDDEAKRITATIKNSALKMGRLIDDLLAFSRMGKKEIIKATVKTREIVKEIIDDQLQRNQGYNAIKWNIKSLPAINADSTTIRQVWVNLISNAIKYSSTKEHPQIEINSSVQDGYIVFYIKDNGVGFDEEYKDKLFKVFQRLHDAEEFEGTGVGLAIVEKIISKHGGKVWAEGKEDEGACFYFSLPL